MTFNFVTIVICSLLFVLVVNCDPIAWIDKPLDSNIVIGEKFTVKYHGFDTDDFRTCVVQLFTADNNYQAPFFECLSASCRAGFYRLKMPLLRPIKPIVLQVKAMTMIEGQAYALTITNGTAYNVIEENILSKRSIGSPFSFPTNPEQNILIDYYTPYYKPYSAQLWIDGNPTILGPSELIEVYWSGLDDLDYENCRIELIADNSDILYVPCPCYTNYVQFTKVNMPNSRAAYFKIVILDENLDEVFYFTSDNSFELIEDPGYGQTKTDVTREISAIMRQLRQRKSYDPYSHYQFIPKNTTSYLQSLAEKDWIFDTFIY